MTAREQLYRLLTPLGIYRLGCGSHIDWELESYLTVLEPARQTLEELKREAFLSTATGEGLRRWEQLLALPPVAGEAPETRRALLIHLLWQSGESARPAGLLRLLEALGLSAQLRENTGPEEFQLQPLAESLPPPQVAAAAKEVAQRFFPAGLQGKFAAGKRSWAQLDALGYSWAQIGAAARSWEAWEQGL